MRRAWLGVLLWFFACSGSSGNPDAGGGLDAGTGLDSGNGPMDSGLADSGIADAGIDAGPCGPLTSSFTRCPMNPLVTAWRPGYDGGFGWTAADPKVIFDGTAGLWRAWWSSLFVGTCGPDVENADKTHIDIMYADSPDGLTWNVQPYPAFTSHVAVGDWDYNTVETPTVLQVPSAPAGQQFVLFYAGANSEKWPDGGFVLPRIAGNNAPWQIGLAFSADGKSFTRLPASQSPYADAGPAFPYTHVAGLVLYAADAFPAFPQAVYGSLADPEIVQLGSTYHLYFSSAGTDAMGNVIVNGANVAYGISHATSTDLVHWSADPGNPLIPGGGQPTIWMPDGGASLEMYFSLNDSSAALADAGVRSLVFPTLGFWHGTSTDTSHWQLGATRELVWDGALAPEDLGLLNGPAIVEHGGELRLYYGAWTDTGVPNGSCALVTPGTFIPGVQVINLARKITP
jgi:hypothetical protein